MSTPFRLPPRKSNAPAQPAQPDAQLGFLEFVTCALCLTPYDGNNDGERRWYMTSCGHILCDDPIHKHRRNTCTLCGRHGATFHPLDDQLSPELHVWFQPSMSHFDALTQSVGVLKFHNSQLVTFVKSLKETVAEQKATMSEAAEEMTSLNNRLEESERRVQELSRQLTEERGKIDKLRGRNAALEQQLASIGSISTPPIARRRLHAAAAQQGLHPQHSQHPQHIQQARHAQQQHLSPEMQYTEPDPLEQAPPVAMSPVVMTRQQAPYPAVPSTPLHQARMSRGMRPSSTMPLDMAPTIPPQPRHMPPQPQHMPPVQQYDNSHDGQDYPPEPIQAGYPSKRQRLDQSNAYAEQVPPNRYSRATTATPFEHRRMAQSEPTPGGRPHSSASFQGRPRNNLDQYRYRGEQVARPQPLQYDPKPSFTLPRRSQATPSGGHTRHGHMYGATPLGAIGEDDEGLPVMPRM